MDDRSLAGLVPFSTVDYPDRLSAVVFTQGCPWRCQYCHNRHLLQTEDGTPELRWGDVLGMLDARRGLLDAVVFSGGEPTGRPGLGAACEDVRERGFEVGLHTGGAFPTRLAQILPVVDWVGLDVKAPFGEYQRTTGVTGSGEAARESLALVIASGVAFEVRTTVHSALLDDASLDALAHELQGSGVQRWVLQPFRALGASQKIGASSYTSEDLMRLTAAFGGERQVRTG